MLLTELGTGEIPDVYRRFAEFVGEAHWRNRIKYSQQSVGIGLIIPCNQFRIIEIIARVHFHAGGQAVAQVNFPLGVQ